MPETEDELIDMHDFSVFSEDKEQLLSLDTTLGDIPTLWAGEGVTEATPTLILESSIFRSAEEVAIDTKVDRLRRETCG